MLTGDLGNLPKPDEWVAEIIEDLRAGLSRFVRYYSSSGRRVS